MSDVALSMRRMSLTSVQSLSERVAPQPLTPHQGERETGREQGGIGGGGQRGRERDTGEKGIVRKREEIREGEEGGVS